MRLHDLVRRMPTPEPWSEHDKIPWDDPGFSRRMLREHLSQAHDAASRRFSRVDRHVRWIHQEVLGGRPSAILDLGCGPGLYTERLAALGHRCTGVDFSPASIEYACATAEESGSGAQYLPADVREADLNGPFDLAMMIFGEINVFRPDDARRLLARVGDALAPNGRLLLEAHTWESVEALGTAPPTWKSYDSGLFGDEPHLLLMESFWNSEAAAAGTRYFSVDAATGDVQQFGQWVQAYSSDGYRALFKAAGFDLFATFPSLTGEADDADFVVLLGRRSHPTS